MRLCLPKASIGISHGVSEKGRHDQNRRARSKAAEKHRMKRRVFIRVIGAGVITAASSGLAGCSSRIPDAAIEAWRGPTPQLDVRRWILSYAILAPHSHKLQSWIVDLGTPDEICCSAI